jgi:hypothetical protein
VILKDALCVAAKDCVVILKYVRDMTKSLQDGKAEAEYLGIDLNDFERFAPIFFIK